MKLLSDYGNIVFCLIIFYSLDFWIVNWKTKNSAVNDSIHCLSSVCSEVFYEWNSDWLGLFPYIWTVLQFPYVVILSCMLFMWHEHILSFSEFTYSWFSLLATDQAFASSLNYKLLAPIYKIMWHQIPDEWS
jgi:hypothetical protein